MDRSRPLYRWRFGPAEYDEARLELRLGGLPVELEPKPLEVLSLLLRHAGEVVTKQELLDEVWRGRVTVEHVLATAVGKLRQALGPEGANLIVTVPRIGYRLQADVSRTAIGHGHSSELALVRGGHVPGRANFLLEQPLGQSHASEVWLARQPRSGARRVFKFATSAERLDLLKREATVARVLAAQLGERNDIARVLDWNFEHAPFFLECAYGGRSLSEWAADGRLDSLDRAGRVALLLRVARAVDAAHEVGVLHKDLKPDNVLIDEAGEVRLTDFGSSRLLDPGQLQALGITALGMTVEAVTDSVSGTLLYLAPELLDGQPATVRSDLYALGVLLYQLLAGDLRRPLTPGWERAVDDPLLAEDIGRATDMLPARRFGSVAEFIDRLVMLDERREALSAAGAAAERAAAEQAAVLRMRARRPWVAAAMLSLGAGLVATLWLQQEATRARADAEREASRAEAVSRFLNDDILGGANPGAAGFERDPSIRELLDRAADGLGARFAADPLTEAGLRVALGQAYHTVGERARAAQHYQAAYERYSESLGTASEPALLSRYDTVRSLAYSATAEGFEAAESLLAEADRLAGTRLGKDDEVTYRAAVARAHYHFQRLQIAPARAALETADRLQRQLHPDDAHAAAWIRGTLGDTLLRSGEPAAAEAHARALLADPLLTPQRVGTGVVAGQRAVLARALRAQGRHAEALELATAAARSYEEVHGERAYLTIITWSLVSSILDASGDCAGALPVAREVDARMQVSFGERNQAALIERGNLGFKELACGDREQGFRLLAEAESGLRRHFGDTNVAANSFRYALAGELSDAGRHADALALLDAVDADAMTASESSAGWPERVRTLRDEIQAKLDQGAGALAAAE
jgi:eukaryotic-like serine/threonine-protein kinase